MGWASAGPAWRVSQQKNPAGRVASGAEVKDWSVQ
jgi:hypothetical protein